MRLSVIVPTYNEEECIENCLRSVEKQNFNKTEYEIIVSDSMSKDKTVELARKYTSNIVITAERGIALGRNKGAKIAKGDILIFLDADAILAQNFLSKCSDVFAKKDVVASTGIAIPIDGKLLQRMVYKATYFLVSLFSFFGIFLFPGICVAYRQKEFNELKGFREDFGIVEDIDLSRRASRIGKCCIMTEAKAYVSTRRLNKYLWSTVLFHIYSDIKYLFTGTAISFYPKTEETKTWHDIWKQ